MIFGALRGSEPEGVSALNPFALVQVLDLVTAALSHQKHDFRGLGWVASRLLKPVRAGTTVMLPGYVHAELHSLHSHGVRGRRGLGKLDQAEEGPPKLRGFG